MARGHAGGALVLKFPRDLRYWYLSTNAPLRAVVAIEAARKNESAPCCFQVSAARSAAAARSLLCCLNEYSPKTEARGPRAVEAAAEVSVPAPEVHAVDLHGGIVQLGALRRGVLRAVALERLRILHDVVLLSGPQRRRD